VVITYPRPLMTHSNLSFGKDPALESYLRPPSYDVVDHQFSFKHPGSPHPSPDPYLWYNSDEVSSMIGDAPPLLFFPRETFDSPVDFTNLFGCNFGNQSSFISTINQPQETYTGSSTFAPSADPLLLSSTHDSEMSQYFHFDF